MLNHLRTLLINRAGPADYAVFGEEALPAEFAPLALPGALERVRDVLFGPDPDKAMLNYRAKQLLACVLASPLAPWLLEFDPRTTDAARPGEADLADPALYAAFASKLSGPAEAALSVWGTPSDAGAQGRLELAFTVETGGGGLTIARRTAPLSSRTYSYTLSGQRSPAFPLPGAGYEVAVNTNAAAAWDVFVRLRPAADLAVLAARLARLGEETLVGVFGLATAEPDLSLRLAWQDQEEAALKLAAIVLAYGRRCEELRRQTGGTA